MKRFFLSILVLVFSCETSDDQVILDYQLEGEWMLTEISCFCAFDPEIDFTETRLLFDVDTSSVTVINDGNYQLFKESGIYKYGGQNNIISFPDETSYQFEVKGSQLSLIYLDEPNIADDEVAYYFRRP
ncbi:hypothetical protein PP182_05935 [Maribacter sp. PR1]|uniref:Lipocalin-like domain-containing protein n=1 Tax=Maribacter cobaltidurans TaxID=1178778 RepID=A0ABU7IRU6_9FLAO|nr:MULTISPECIES: hypothetical protein [Maribacter]MDC6388211.1 hypothetical protein [Maribacter sp. PR1]MEE1975599.1 hypothetical protein [Maribacter cobaltidurans]